MLFFVHVTRAARVSLDQKLGVYVKILGNDSLEVVSNGLAMLDVSRGLGESRRWHCAEPFFT